ncbi:biphenyl 2,3-dioxygenase [Planococcus plakortidis]|uniref:Biphenyl 2,3-dioxygenase n=1 Tax=Planococcus plakortidis TaxID=1038856 RepID=A0A1C7ECX3_9BACL|nr:PAS domain-containing protein [Planococcus plakortidis]ANU21720.1 biphenyl 2,3-dioxygenase [Planococcus plakortidis]
MEVNTQIQLLEAMLDGSKVGTIVTDPEKEDNPIIYTNRTFTKMTGYEKGEILGRNCRFLQGPKTDPEAVDRLRQAIKNQEKVTVVLRNYRKDGTPFWNRLAITPVTVEEKLYFIGTQTDITVEKMQQEAIDKNESEIEKLMLPILSIQPNVATVALVGTMNLQRFEALKVKLCEYVSEHRIEHALLDITGLTWNEESPLHWFTQICEALRIMGSHLYITGVTPQAATELVRDLDRENMLKTYSSIEKALADINE